MDPNRDSRTYRVEVGHQLLLAMGQPPRNDVVKVQFMLHDVVCPFSFRSGEVHPAVVFHQMDFRGTRMAQVKVPILELGYIDQMPSNSRSVVQIKLVMEELGIPPNVERLMVRKLQLESLLLRQRLSPTFSRQIVFTVDVMSYTYELVTDNGHEELEEEEGDIAAVLEESFQEASTSVYPETELEESTIKMLESLVLDEGTAKEMCTVCQDDIESGSQVARLPCSHVYHQACIIRWLRVSQSCPICRYQLHSVSPISNIS